MSKPDRSSTGYAIKQRAFLKFYLISMIERKRGYASEMFNEIHDDFKEFGYKPNQKEVYSALDDLVDDGFVYRVKKPQPNIDAKHKEVVYYKFVDNGGYEAAMLYKQNVKVELDRFIGVLRKAISKCI